MSWSFSSVHSFCSRLRSSPCKGQGQRTWTNEHTHTCTHACMHVHIESQLTYKLIHYHTTLHVHCMSSLSLYRAGIHSITPSLPTRFTFCLSCAVSSVICLVASSLKPLSCSFKPSSLSTARAWACTKGVGHGRGGGGGWGKPSVSAELHLVALTPSQ